MKTVRRLVTIAAAVITAVAMTALPAQAAHTTIKVMPGTGTISAAVAAAHPGDTLKLAKGTYNDSVFIPISLTIEGSGWDTVIMPPATSTNPCNMGSMEGLCAAGAFDSSGNPDVTKPVVNVRIKDLRTTGFSDTGVLGFNTRGLKVTHVKSDHNGGYGIARFVSTKSLFDHNLTSWNGEAGLYMGDSPHADSIVSHNTSDNNGFGIFLRDSTDITASDNRVFDNCVGIFALNSGQGAPGDLPAGDYRIIDNSASDNNNACPGGDHPALSGVGIGLFGVHDTWVSGNVVRDNNSSSDSIAKGGVVLFSTAFIGGADASNNTVRNNVVKNNKPADIVWDSKGTGNSVQHNNCRKAIPGNLGWCPSH
jgi:parallel beta-helix repeat protein